jgi:hypothetical protein
LFGNGDEALRHLGAAVGALDGVNVVARRVVAGEEAGAAGGAVASGGVAVGERHALAGEGVEVRGFVEVGALPADVLPAEVVGEDEDDVGPARGGCGGEERQGEREASEEAEERFQGRGSEAEEREAHAGGLSLGSLSFSFFPCRVEREVRENEERERRKENEAALLKFHRRPASPAGPQAVRVGGQPPTRSCTRGGRLAAYGAQPPPGRRESAARGRGPWRVRRAFRATGGRGRLSKAAPGPAGWPAAA